MLVFTIVPAIHTALQPAPQQGSVATTAVAGGGYNAGTAIYGPFEDGFGSSSSSILTNLGCPSGASVDVPAGVDVFTSEQMIAAQCGITLPRTENNAHVGLLDACGASTADGHFVEDLSCLYDDSDANSGHSTKVGMATDGVGTGVYGKWEDRSRLAIPALDACNGHFGVTPDSNGAVVYHHHVAGLPPFTVGCFGPAADPSDSAGMGRLVSTQACRDLYPECGDGDYVTVTTSTGSKLYDPYCPCFSGFSNVDETKVPPLSPPPVAASPPSPVSSPSPSSPDDGTINPEDWPGCTADDIAGDFDHNGRATLGDAVHIANARLQYGSTGVNPIACLNGDFDMDGSFTLNDAAHVAEAQFSKAFLPWQISSRRHLSATSTPPKAEMLFTLKKGASERQVEVHIHNVTDALTGAWKALSVQFAHDAKIASVDMPYGEAGKAITAMHAGSFFQAAALGGSAAAWPVGHAATVTFEADTNMAALTIDYGSMNSYVVLQADPACKPANGAPCATRLSKAKAEAEGEAKPEAKPVANEVAKEPEAVSETAVDADAMKKETDSDFYLLSMLVLASFAVVLVLMSVTKILRARRTVPVEAVDVKIEPVTPSSRC